MKRLLPILALVAVAAGWPFRTIKPGLEAVVVQPPPQFNLYFLDDQGFPTNRISATGYNLNLPVTAFRQYRVVAAKVSGASESDFSSVLSFVPTNSTIILLWSEPVFLKLYLQTTNNAFGQFADTGPAFMALTNPTGAMQFFKLRIAVTNAP